MSINWDVLRDQLVDVAVVAANGTAQFVLRRAITRVPVRKIFKGGRQTKRLRTVREIRGDAALRAGIGVSPTGLTDLHAGQALLRSLAPEELGSSWTIEHMGSKRRGLARTGLTDLHSGNPVFRETPSRRERGLTSNRANRANTYQPHGRDDRVLDPDNPGRLLDPRAQARTNARGRYELKSGRAVVRKLGIDSLTGEVVTVRARLGGGLRETLEVRKASAEQFPVIEALVVAGDEKHPYAIHQELGNRHNPAHPFLRPSLAEAREVLPDQLRRALRRVGR